MRNTKVKTLKKTAILTLSLLLISAGVAFADAWTDFGNQAVTGKVEHSGNITATSTLKLINPTVPVPAYLVETENNTITGNGFEGSIINATDKTAAYDPVKTETFIINTSFKDGKILGTDAKYEGFDLGGGAIKNDNIDLMVGTYAYGKDKDGNDVIDPNIPIAEKDRATFSNNQAVNGGAILSTGDSAVMYIENINFKNNLATATRGTNVAYGGAIFNGSTAVIAGYPNLKIFNSGFDGNQAKMTGGGFGGAIHHDYGQGLIANDTFKNNFATSEGGAISNRADLNINDSKFEENSSNSGGGAITNGFESHTAPIDATIIINNSEFTKNRATSFGGAISNKPGDTAAGTTHTVYIKNGTTFDGNYAASETGAFGSSSAGGAIYNQGAGATAHTDAVLNISGREYVFDEDNNLVLDSKGNPVYNIKEIVFKNNVAKNGGAIYNQGSTTIDYATFDSNGIGKKDTVAENLMTSKGGAIYNSVQNNVTTGTSSAGSTIIQNSTFKNNRASENGGAIYNGSQMTIINSNFENNGAGYDPELEYGGAIYTTVNRTPAQRDINAQTTILSLNKNVIDAEGNEARVGNVFNIGNENSLANKTDSVVFEGYYDKVSNTAHPATGYFGAQSEIDANGNKINSVINIYSDVYGSYTTVEDSEGNEKEILLSNVNFGKDKAGNLYNGLVHFNGKSTLTSSNVNIYAGTVQFDHDRSFDKTNILNMYGGTLDLLNGEYGPHQLQAREFNLLGDSTIRLDVDLAGKQMDGIFTEDIPVITNPGHANKLTIDEMYARTDTPNDSERIKFTDAPALTNGVVQYDETKLVQSPTTKYAVTKDDVDGDGVYFGFNKIGPSDPAISGPVAAQAAYIMMDNIYRQSFANMDMVALMTPEQREMIKALRGGNRIDWKREKGYVTGVFAPNTVPEERDAIYVRPFANFENIRLKNGPKVSNVFYGSLIGGESDLIDLGHGWDGTFSFFGAYHGSHQAYNGVDIWQNGGSLGAVGTVYKGRFFSGLTANVGATAAEARHGFGNDQFPILMTGAAWKSGYNLGMFSNKLVLQPSYMMSYTFINVFDYNSASGARMTQDPLNVLEIVPGVKLIGNFKDGWQPYIGANITWNLLDKTRFYANNVMLPQMSVKPFVEYGVGLQKRYGDRFTGYGQAMFRNGGRNGVAFTLGLRWALGN